MSRVLSIRRRLLRWSWILVPLAICAVAALFRDPLLSVLGFSTVEEDPLTCSVVRRDFMYDVSVQGELESAANSEVRCEVHSQTSDWIRILEVIPEGKHVNPGDFLVRLDSSGLESERDRQRIYCEQSTATLIQARARYESAKLAKQSYPEGEYRVAHENSRLDLLVAQEHERTARQSLECSRKLASDGYITDLQLRADEYAWTAARTELGTARIKLGALENFTRPTQLTKLSAAVVTSKALLTAAEYQYKRNYDRLADIEEQIKKCVVRAPVSGQAVLAHLFHYGHAHMIEPGEMTMEKRVLVRLPDFHRMQVAAKIEEDKIALVQPGMAVTVHMEAFPDLQIRGRVVKINEYPEQEDWLGSAVSQYKTIVQIDEPPPGTRPGMTAELKIHVQSLAGRLQVPCPAVLRHGDRDYCITLNGGRFKAREVKLGPNNGSNWIVRDGLAEGEQVVLSAAAHKDKIDLPPLPKQTLAAHPIPAIPQGVTRTGISN